jgi:Zn-dependent protease
VSSQFSSGEILSIIVAWIVLSVAITYQSIIGSITGAGRIDIVVAGFIATATGFILHEMGHKYVAIRRGYLAHFRLWIWGLVLTISIVTLSGGGLVFGAPGAVYIAPAAAQFYGYDSGRGTIDPEEDNMIISAAGPGINLTFAIGFLVMLFLVPTGFLSTVADFGLLLNVGLGSFNMLPVSLLDGAKIFRKSIPIGLGIALPLWAMFIIFNFVI